MDPQLEVEVLVAQLYLKVLISVKEIRRRRLWATLALARNGIQATSNHIIIVFTFSYKIVKVSSIKVS